MSSIIYPCLQNAIYYWLHVLHDTSSIYKTRVTYVTQMDDPYPSFPSGIYRHVFNDIHVERKRKRTRTSINLFFGYLSRPLMIKIFEIFRLKPLSKPIWQPGHLLHTLSPTKFLCCMCHHHRWRLLCHHKSVIWYWLLSSMCFSGSCP
jgi:hypothetical protein